MEVWVEAAVREAYMAGFKRAINMYNGVDDDDHDKDDEAEWDDKADGDYTDWNDKAKAGGGGCPTYQYHHETEKAHRIYKAWGDGWHDKKAEGGDSWYDKTADGGYNDQGKKANGGYEGRYKDRAYSASGHEGRDYSHKRGRSDEADATNYNSNNKYTGHEALVTSFLSRAHTQAHTHTHTHMHTHNEESTAEQWFGFRCYNVRLPLPHCYHTMMFCCVCFLHPPPPTNWKLLAFLYIIYPHPPLSQAGLRNSTAIEEEEEEEEEGFQLLPSCSVIHSDAGHRAPVALERRQAHAAIQIPELQHAVARATEGALRSPIQRHAGQQAC